MTIDYLERIPNNIDLAGNRALRRALEHWQPRFLEWWREMGPSGFQTADVYLRTAVSVDAAGWASFGRVNMPDYRWGIFLAEAEPDRRIGFGDDYGAPVWQQVPGEYRSTLRRLIVTQGDTEPASVEQQRLLGHTAPSLYDLRNLFQVNVEEGRHLWAMVYLLHAYFGRDGRVLAAREARLLEVGSEGIALAAPARVDTERQDRLPLVLAVRFDGRRSSEFPLAANTVIVAADPNGGRVQLAPVFKQPRAVHQHDEQRRPATSDASLAIRAAKVMSIDAKSLLELPWSAGRWSFTVLYYDWASNPVMVELTGRSGAAAPAAAGIPKSSTPPARCTAEVYALPCYRKTGDGPVSPKLGLVFTTSYHSTQQTQRLLLRGSFTLPLPMGAKRDSDAGSPTLVPITLLLLGADGERWQLDFGVPARTDGGGAAARTTGYFAMDVLEPETPPLEHGKYAAYLVAAGEVYGPRIFSVPDGAKTGPSHTNF